MARKYVSIDVGSAMCIIRIESEERRVLHECFVETKAAELIDFFRKVGVDTTVVFEEGCQSKWLYDLIRPYAAEVIVCDVREKKREGSKSDKIDTVKLLDWLRGGTLKRVYQGEPEMRGLKEVARAYLAVVGDMTRVMNRIKAVFRSQGLRCVGKKVYTAEGRKVWLPGLGSGELRLRVEQLYRHLDFLLGERRTARQALIQAARRHGAYGLLNQIPGLGPVRVALILAYVMYPHRFRTKRQFWCYCGLAIVTWSTGEYEMVKGRVVRNKKKVLTRGLNWNRNAILKEVFKGAAQTASRAGMKTWFQAACARGLSRDHATLDLARKIAAIALAIWKTGTPYDPKLISKAA